MSEKEKSNKVDITEHTLSVAEICQKYGTQVNEESILKSKGLSEDVIKRNIATYGTNVLTPPKKTNPFLRFLHFFTGLFNLMLIFSAIISFALYGMQPSNLTNLILALILLVVAIMNALIEFIQEYKAEALISSFQNLVPARCILIRDGAQVDLLASEIAVGDIVVLKSGDKIPADVRIIQCAEIKVDNSSLTGESEPQERFVTKGSDNPLEATNLGFFGTVIVNGSGYGIVIRTGDRTVLGNISNLVGNAEKRESQLTSEINIFVRKMAAVAFFFFILFTILGLAIIYPVSVKDATTRTNNISSTFQFAIGILVSFCPEGLPTTVTILLTIAAKRLAKMNVLVKNLTAVETLGSITLLASDKTGTLTQNRMSVVATWINLEINNVADMDHGDNDKGHGKGINNIDELTKICCLCSKSRFDENDKATPIEDRKVFGDATETGLLRFAAVHQDVETIYVENQKVFEIPFSSSTKWHITVHKRKHATGSLVMYLKGAPERVLKMCSKIQINDEVLPLSAEHSKKFNEVYEVFAGQGQRVLAFAMILLPEKYDENYKFVADPSNFPIHEFTFVGLCSLMDPPKRGVRKAVAACRSAGIQVVMVTGDHPLTAEAIARKIGIIQGETAKEVSDRLKKPVSMIKEDEYDAVVIHGEKLDDMTNEEWDLVLSKREIVFARTAPHHKLMIVGRCQNKGHIVGVSGDGVNDSPALKKADLGISMNITGSDVSKEAAAMILLDDNFPSIIVGISQGRLIFSNLKKSIRYTLTHILPEAISAFVFIIFQVPNPLSAALILLIDLGTELLPALSYAWEEPDSDLMLFPPRKVLCTEGVSNAGFDAEVGGKKGSKDSRSFGQNVVNFFKRQFTANETGETLIDNDLILWSYLEAGLLSSAICVLAYLASLSLDCINLSKLLGSAQTMTTDGSGNVVNMHWGSYSADMTPVDLFRANCKNTRTEAQIMGSSNGAYYFGIVIFQWFTLFVCKRQYDYPMGLSLFKNTKSLMGVIFAALFASFLIYTPELNLALGGYDVNILVLLIPIAGGIILVLYEFIRKYLRKLGYFGGVPKKNKNLLELVRTASTA